VKLAASIRSSRSAARHKSEFAANAIIAAAVNVAALPDERSQSRHEATRRSNNAAIRIVVAMVAEPTSHSLGSADPRDGYGRQLPGW
jgi:hypothetical protein